MPSICLKSSKHAQAVVMCKTFNVDTV